MRSISAARGRISRSTNSRHRSRIWRCGSLRSKFMRAGAQVDGAAAPERAPGEDARVTALVHDDLPVHDHLLDADRELLRLAPRGRRLHGLRVEDDDVGLEAVAEEPAVGQAQALGGERRHLADGVRQAEPALLADELGQDDRERAVGPRAGIVPDQDRVAADHVERVAHEAAAWSPCSLRRRRTRPAGPPAGGARRSRPRRRAPSAPRPRPGSAPRSDGAPGA